MRTKKKAVAAIVATTAALSVGGIVAFATTALADTNSPQATLSSSSASTEWPQGPGGHHGFGPGGFGPAGHGFGPGSFGRPAGTEVTGAELAKLTAAIDAKYPGTTVAHAIKAPDGTYYALGSNATSRVMLKVSNDLATITEKEGPSGFGPGWFGPGGRGFGPGSFGRPAGTEVTGAELAKLTAAIDAKYPGTTVAHAIKAPDGTYYALGSNATSRVMLKVSNDLATITQRR